MLICGLREFKGLRFYRLGKARLSIIMLRSIVRKIIHSLHWIISIFTHSKLSIFMPLILPSSFSAPPKLVSSFSTTQT